MSKTFIWFSLLIFNSSSETAVIKNESGPFFPGTKWCGPGNGASSEKDFGRELFTDECCQHHDHCKEYIMPGETAHGLENNARIVLMHCDCDRKLMECLYENIKEKKNKESSQGVGYIFYNFFGPMRCFKEHYPVTGCNKYVTKNGFKRCAEYEFDKTGTKKWQFFPDPFFSEPGDDYWSFM